MNEQVAKQPARQSMDSMMHEMAAASQELYNGISSSPQEGAFQSWEEQKFKAPLIARSLNMSVSKLREFIKSESARLKAEAPSLPRTPEEDIWYQALVTKRILGGHLELNNIEIQVLVSRLIETKNPYFRDIRRKDNEKAKIIAVSNFKGGVAKTSTVAMTSQGLARRGLRVLIIDLDAQASLTGHYFHNPDSDFKAEHTLWAVFRGEARFRDQIRTTRWPGIDIVPANLELFNSEIELPRIQTLEVEAGNTDFRFWRILQEEIKNSGVLDEYDVVMMDCPPALSFLTLSAVYAADGIIVPLPPRMLDFSSARQFFKLMLQHYRELSTRDFEEKDLDFVKVLPVMVKTQSLSAIQTWQNMVAEFGDNVFETVIPESEAVPLASQAAFAEGKLTIYEYIPDSRGKKSTRERILGQIEDFIDELIHLIERGWGRDVPAGRSAAEREIVAVNDLREDV